MPSLPQVTPNGALFVAIAGQGASDSPDDPLIIRSRPVRVNLALLVDARVGQLIEANLFDDVDLSVELDNRDTAGSGSLVWTGHVVGVEGSQATFVLGGGQMAGDIVLPNAHYEIRYAEPDRYVIYQIDPTAFPPDEPPV